ncbi:MAG: RNA-binding protein [Lentisphaeria bacterium]|nr:RNA-binding protein [Lentisphaeria bacterium]
MSRTVFVENVDPKATVEALRKLLPAGARVDSIEINDDPKAEDGAKAAFLSAASGRTVASVVQALDGQTCAGRVLKAKVLKQRGGKTGGMGAGGSVGGGLGRGARDGGKRSIFGGGKNRGQGGGRGR